jgi:hypothetical protein
VTFKTKINKGFYKKALVFTERKMKLFFCAECGIFLSLKDLILLKDKKSKEIFVCKACRRKLCYYCYHCNKKIPRLLNPEDLIIGKFGCLCEECGQKLILERLKRQTSPYVEKN